jgi:transcriptional regulator with XRE-family HTH domain
MNKNTTKRIPLYKIAWCKIRYWQQLNDISDIDLAHCLDVSERTLREYDKNASNITLSRIDRFLYAYNLSITDLLNV